jgi:hypothetical protein
MVQQEGQGVVDDPRANGVIVVEHEDEVTPQLQDLVAQRGEDRLEFFLCRQGCQESPRWLPKVIVDRLDGGDHLQQEAHGIVVPLLERDPGYRKFAAPAPVGQQCRLAEPGRRGDNGQLPPDTLVQPPVEALARNISGRTRGT